MVRNSLALLAFAPVFAHAGILISSLEQFNYQNGGDTLVVRSYDAFDEIEDIPGVTGYTVAVNDGTPEAINPNPEYNGAYKRRQSVDTLGEMLTARPVGATYTHTLTGATAGTATIASPAFAYADAIPANPLFTISGVTGAWGTFTDGRPVFHFDPATVTSFTVTMNRYSDGDRAGFQQGQNYAYAFFVADVSTEDYNVIDEQHSGLLADGDPDARFSVTFTKDLPLDGGDSDPTTYGFTAGSFFNLEGEFVNIFDLSESDLPGHEQAFIYQTVTALLISATPIPEPSAAAQLLGLVGLGFAAARRGRR
jgi:hypothetical protein